MTAPQPARAVVLAGVRTPIGRYGGALAGVRPDDLAAIAIARRVDRAGVDPAEIDDVYPRLRQPGRRGQPQRRPHGGPAGRVCRRRSPGVTVNRLCASGLPRSSRRASGDRAATADVVVAGGVESMSRAPLVMAKPERRLPARRPHGLSTRRSAGASATRAWRRCSRSSRWARRARTSPSAGGVSREEQDAFALRSQQRWAAAAEAGRFDDELVPGRRRSRGDEHPRPETTAEALAGCSRPSATAAPSPPGNSSGINDGAAALVVASEERAASSASEPLGAFVGIGGGRRRPARDGHRPGPGGAQAARAGGRGASATSTSSSSTRRSRRRASPSCRELGLDPERVNVNGGAIALGHPLGMSGARLVVSLLHELRRRGGRYGLATLCVGVGQGQAALFERSP